MIPATILDAMIEAKERMGHTDPDAVPSVHCPACRNEKAMTWQAVDTEKGRGFWTEESACSICAEVEEATRNKEALRSRYTAAGVPPIYQKYTLRARTQPCGRISLPDLEPQDDAQCICNDYKVPGWLCLVGSVGVGKTTILSALFCDMILKDRCRRSFLWDTESGLFKRADIAAEKSHAARMKVMDEAAKADVLMLDDLAGNRRALTDWQGGAIRDLVDERHRYQRATFFTSNILEWPHLEQRYGSHVVSRLMQASLGLIMVGGRDMRYGVGRE